MARVSSRTYDYTTGIWSKSTTTTKDTKETKTKTKTTEPKSSDKENLTSTTSDSSSSKGKSEKKYNEIEYNTLELGVNFVANDKTIVIGAGDTITIKGIGKYLSGKYYVQDVTRSISSSGYSHSATLLKTDMGNKLKMSTSTNKKTEKTKTKKVTSSSKSTNKPQRTYTVKKGDCLWKIAKKFYGNGALYTKIYDANSKQIAKPNLIYVGQKLVIP